MKNIKYIFAIIFAFSSICLSFNLKEEIKVKKLPTYIIENTSYLSLKSLLKILNAEDSYGKLEDRVLIVYDSKEIIFRINDKRLIVSGNTQNLNAPIKEIEGEILIPVNDFSQLFSDAKKPEPKIETEKKATVSAGVTYNKNKDFVILIDPGHGGSDAGAVGSYGLKEKDVNLDVALRMSDYLKKGLKKYPHIQIYLTRDTDIFISLEKRVQMSKSIQADLFFSIHTNSAKHNRYDVSGFETYYPNSKATAYNLPTPSNIDGLEEDTNTSSSLSEILEELNRTNVIDDSRTLADFVQERMAERLLTPDRGTKRRNFYVLKFTPMPSVLTEIGFICNPNIELNLKDIEVRDAIAITLGNALMDFLKFKDVLPKTAFN